MTTDTDMKIDYAVVLKQLQDELDGMDERRQALLASISAIKRLVSGDEKEVSYPPSPDEPPRMPAIPPNFFAGMTPTEGYRQLMQRWPGHYRPPQIADLFMAGGIDAANRTALVQAIHSVLKRARAREAADERRRAANVLPMVRSR